MKLNVGLQVQKCAPLMGKEPSRPFALKIDSQLSFMMEIFEQRPKHSEGRIAEDENIR